MHLISSRLLYSCLLVLLFCSSVAQNRKLDSLKALLKTKKEDTTRAKLLNNISSRLWRIGQSTEAVEYAEHAKNLAEKLMSHSDAIVVKAGKKELASAYNNYAIAFWQQGNYIVALDYNFKSLRMYEDLGDKHGIAAALNNIGLVYDSEKNSKKALEYYIKSSVLMQALGDTSAAANTFNNIAGSYSNLGDLEKALNYYDKSLELKKNRGNKISIASTLMNIGSVYETKREFEKARSLFSQALELNKEAGNDPGIAVSYVNLGTIDSKVHLYASAEKYFQKALELSLMLQSKDYIKESYTNLALIDSLNGNWKQAYFHHLLAIAYRDSLLNEENTANTVRLQMNYEFEKKEQATKLEQEKKDTIVNEEKRRQKIIILAVSAGLGLVLILALVIFRSLLQNKKKNRIITAQKELVETQKVNIELKQKEILDSIKYARRIQTALIPTDALIARELKRLKK